MDACGMRVAGGRRSEGETTRRKKGETREGGGVLHTACRGDDGRSDVTLSLMFGGSACDRCVLFSDLAFSARRARFDTSREPRKLSKK